MCIGASSRGRQEHLEDADRLGADHAEEEVSVLIHRSPRDVLRGVGGVLEDILIGVIILFTPLMVAKTGLKYPFQQTIF